MKRHETKVFYSFTNAWGKWVASDGTAFGMGAMR
jgi:hypothetical protein